MSYQREFLGSGMFNAGPSGAIFRADALRALGGFEDFGIPSDFLFWLRACATVPVLLLPADLFWYRVHPAQELQSERAEREYAVIIRAVWAALADEACPLTPDEREQARRNVIAKASQASLEGRAGATLCAGPSSLRSRATWGEWLRCLGRPRRDGMGRHAPCQRRWVRHAPIASARRLWCRAGDVLMKIVQGVGWYYPESWGGTEIYVAGLSRRLRALGHDVAVAAPDPSQPHARHYSHDGIPVYRYPIPSEPTRAEAQGGTTVRGAERFHQWLAAFRPDVVHLHTFVTGLGLAEVDAARSVGARVIVTTHSASLGFICARGTMMRWGTDPCDGITEASKCTGCMLEQRGMSRRLASLVAEVPAPIARLARHLPGRAGAVFALPDFIRDQQARQRRLLSSVDRFVLLTDWARDTVLANGAPPAKVAVNRLGMTQRPPGLKPGPETRPTTLPLRLAYVGRFDPIKGVDDLVQALTSLPRELPFRARLIGPVFTAAERRVVDRLRRAIGTDPRITIDDPVPHARMLQSLDGSRRPVLSFAGRRRRADGGD